MGVACLHPFETSGCWRLPGLRGGWKAGEDQLAFVRCGSPYDSGVRRPRSPGPTRSTGRVVLVIAVSAAAIACCDRGARSSAEWRRAVDAAETPLEAAIRRFDAAAERGDRAAALASARDAAEAGRAARDRVGSIQAPPELAASQREELVFLNHVIPGFDRFGRSEGGAADAAELRAILQRGRAHQRRARSPGR
jgi:hypothetical protein